MLSLKNVTLIAQHMRAWSSISASIVLKRDFRLSASDLKTKIERKQVKFKLQDREE